jgi:metal-responsive CopG/Arc/MetJ family transcriptional regulator
MKKEKSSKYLTIRIPESLMAKFQDTCADNYKSMSEALRDLIQEYIKRNGGVKNGG